MSAATTAPLVSSFIASAVEFVEALTVVLAVGFGFVVASGGWGLACDLTTAHERRDR